jgi:hypothetical protein
MTPYTACCDPAAWGLLKERIGKDKLREAEGSLISAARELSQTEWDKLRKRLKDEAGIADPLKACVPELTCMNLGRAQSRASLS